MIFFRSTIPGKSLNTIIVQISSLLNPLICSNSISLDRVKYLLAVYCRKKDFRDLSTSLASSNSEGIGGMEMFRILEDGTIVKLKGLAAAKHPNAGYRFVFKKGNDTKFDHQL